MIPPDPPWKGAISWGRSWKARSGPLYSRDGWLEALDAVLAVQVRHPVWTSRLAELHGVVVEGAGVDRALLDALVERFPLDG